MHQPKKRIWWLSAIIIVSIAVAWLVAGMGDSTSSKGTDKNYVIYALRFSPKGTVLHVSRGILDEFAKPCEIVEYWGDSWGVAFRSQPNILTRVPCAMTSSAKTKSLVTLTVRAEEWRRGTPLFYPFFGLVFPAFAAPNPYGGHDLIYWDGNLQVRRLTRIEFPSKDDESLPTEYRRFASSQTDATALSFNSDESLLAVGVSRWGQRGILDPEFSPPPVLRDPKPIPNLIIDTRKIEPVAHWPEGYRHVQRAARKDWWLACNPGLAIYDAKNTQLIRRCNEEFAKPLIATWLGETDQIIAIDNQKRILVLNSELSDC